MNWSLNQNQFLNINLHLSWLDAIKEGSASAETDNFCKNKCHGHLVNNTGAWMQVEDSKLVTKAIL